MVYNIDFSPEPPWRQAYFSSACLWHGVQWSALSGLWGKLSAREARAVVLVYIYIYIYLHIKQEPRGGPVSPWRVWTGRSSGIKKTLEFVTFGAFWTPQRLGGRGPSNGKLGRPVLGSVLGSVLGQIWGSLEGFGGPVWGKIWALQRPGELIGSHFWNVLGHL